MKIKSMVPVGIVPFIFMIYGWYLGQLHQSGYDIAGIFLFITGGIGLILALIIYRFTKKYFWHNQWFANVLIGLAGCGMVFALIYVYARWHG
jgi:hypothetical protein